MKPNPWQPARHLPQITVRWWLGRYLDQGGGGGGDAKSGVGGDCSAAGEGGGEGSAPSTCSIATLSAGDNASIFFLALVILVDLTGLLQPVFGVADADWCSCRRLQGCKCCCCCMKLLLAGANCCC